MRAGTRRGRALAVATLGALSLGACGSGSSGSPRVPGSSTASALPQGSDAVELDPAAFTVDITNEWWPMAVGDRWVYRETDGEGGAARVEVTVLDETYTVAAGIEARVVHDVVSQDGAVVEDTRDWYAQDADGNVWYLGEQTAEYENGRVVSTEGSWEAGVEGARPGIAVPAGPRAGLAYRQEYLADEAEDAAVVLSIDEQVQTATGTYRGVLMIRETTPLEPDVAELKFYAPGVGQVLAVQISGGVSREDLVETTRAG